MSAPIERPPGGICGACKTPKDCARDNFCFRRDNAERQMRRRIDLCTCGKPREDAVHGCHVSYGGGNEPPAGTLHSFMPNPQPPPIPTTSFNRIHVLRINGTWSADVYDGAKVGRGQAALWLDAVNAAIEDLKEKS
jgi:hypothetical protein